MLWKLWPLPNIRVPITVGENWSVLFTNRDLRFETVTGAAV
jgi:hypothetical protein